MSDSDYFDRLVMPATVDLEQLDRYQREFVESEARDVRVIAPAGSGKTQTLLWRCLHLLEWGRSADPRFLIVTFTVAARAELQKRLQTAEFRPLENFVKVSTLNGWGWAEVRRRSGELEGEPRILSRRREKEESVALLPDLPAKHAQVDRVLRNGRGLAAALLDHVDALKNLGFRLDEEWTEEQFLAHRDELVGNGVGPQLDALIERLQKLRILSDPKKTMLDVKLGLVKPGDGPSTEKAAKELYERFYPFGRDLFKSTYRRNWFTMDDQKYVALLHLELEEKPPPANVRLSHVLVDEFQDISPLDLSLVKRIADWHGASVTIVGDDDQAIFEWRGGAPGYLLNPERHFGRGFETHVLERNYRCPRNLVLAADKLIRNNERRYPKRMESVVQSNATIMLEESINSAAAVDFVMEEVRGFLAGRGPQDRMALLARKKAQLVPYQILFADEDIDFEAADDLKIFLSRAFNSLIRMIEIRSRRERSQSAQQIVADTLHLCRHVRSGGPKRQEIEHLEKGLRRNLPSSYGSAHEKLKELQKAMRIASDGPVGPADYARAMLELLAAKKVVDVIKVISDRFEGLGQDFGRGEQDIFYRDPPFFYLASVATRFRNDFRGFLETLNRARASAAKQQGETQSGGRDRPYKPVELATALRAKGKEFHTVAILDANGGVWPSALAETDVELEGERRLFYVAMTRGRQRLIVSWSQRDLEGRELTPSPYLGEAGWRETRTPVRSERAGSGALVGKVDAPRPVLDAFLAALIGGKRRGR